MPTQVSIDLPIWQSDAAHILAAQMMREGWRFEGSAQDLVESHVLEYVCDAAARTFGGIILTPRELGCTEHPLTEEVLDVSRLMVASRKYLPAGQVLQHADPLAFLAYCEKGLATPTLVAAMHPVDGDHLLQAVRLPEGNRREHWVYSVSTKGGKRWSLDQPFLFRIASASEVEQREIVSAQLPKQSTVRVRHCAGKRPKVLANEYPGQYCGQEAIRSILWGFNIKTTLLDHRLRGLLWLWGLVYNLWLARTVPWDIALMLRKHGLKAYSRFWTTGSFERRLIEALDRNRIVDVIGYAQRRYHGQHSMVVSGYEVYHGRHYWYVTDAQFGLEEYKLPHGNALLSTAELIASFPRYVLWLGAVGVFVVVVQCPTRW